MIKKAHNKAEWNNLAAVGVAGKHQVEAPQCGRLDPRLVLEQDRELPLAARAEQRDFVRQCAAAAQAEAGVIDAGQAQPPAVELHRLAAATFVPVFVETASQVQRPQPDPLIHDAGLLEIRFPQSSARVRVAPGFDAPTLARLLDVLERRTRLSRPGDNI